MPEKRIRFETRLTKKNRKKLKNAFAKMYKVDKAKSENDVINHLIETYL